MKFRMKQGEVNIDFYIATDLDAGLIEKIEEAKTEADKVKVAFYELRKRLKRNYGKLYPIGFV